MLIKDIQNENKEHLLCEMARIGKMGSYDIWVWTDDPGKIPHFHMWDYSTKGKKFHACIRIDSAEYFFHTGKEDVLNHKLKKELVAFLQSKSDDEDDGDMTNWEVLLQEWNRNNSDVKVSRKQEMPNYMDL